MCILALFLLYYLRQINLTCHSREMLLVSQPEYTFRHNNMWKGTEKYKKLVNEN